MQQVAQVERDTPWNALPELLTPDEFMRLAAMSRSAVYEGVKRGSIPAVRYGRLIRIRKGALLESAR